MSNISLEASVRTCKVNSGWANKIESDRFLNPNNMVCPVWNERDLTGRRVCADSFWTKRAGCNSAEDRISVENHQRPQYSEYITLDAQGIQGDMYGGDGVENFAWMEGKNLIAEDAMRAQNIVDNVHNYTGQFGLVTGFQQNIEPTCANYPYEYAMAQVAQDNRLRQQAYHAGQSQNRRMEYSYN
jgi:hypothetical protein